MNRKLTIDKVKLIPQRLEEGRSYHEIADELGVAVRTVQYWIVRLKNAQVKLNITRGPKPMNLDQLQ